MTGLEALNKIDNEVLYGVYAQEHYSNEIETIRKSLKALEIIKEKECDVCELKICIDEYDDSLYQYNKRMHIQRFKLTQEEFDTLKEILE